MPPRLLPPVDIRPMTEQQTVRSDGLHLSTITGDILIGMDPDRYGEREGGAKWMNFLMGLIFEDAIINAYQGRVEKQRMELIRIGEVYKDGVLGTPDNIDMRYPRPVEYKCTKKSCRQPITDKKFWHYWVQLKAYAYMIGVREGELDVLHINGNYSRDDNDPNNGYIINPWEDDWTDLELLENWMMLIKHAIRRRWLAPVLVTSFNPQSLVDQLTIEMRNLGHIWVPLEG